MNTVVYANNKEVRDILLSTRDANETIVAENTAFLEILRDNSFKLFLAQIEKINELSLKTLGHIHRILANEGQIIVKFTDISKEDYEQFLKLLRATGFKNNAPTQGATTNQINFIKPEFQQAASLKSQIAPQVNQPAQTNNTENVYGQYMHSPVVQVEPQQQVIKKKNAFDTVKIANNTVDEDALLKNDTISTPANPSAAVENCSTKPKACKNCTCGRKEQEQTMTEEQMVQALERGDLKSSCGNCYLGDAFRCASCPYKGLPAFKPGDKVKLDLQLSDTNIGQKQEGDVKVEGGKVKIAL